VVLFADRKTLAGFLSPAALGRADTIELLTVDGEQTAVPLEQIKSIFFVRDFTENYAPERKSFLSRPKIEGLWVRLDFSDGDQLEGIVPNDLLGLLDHGVQITPPDLHGNTLRMFIPRSALRAVTVLGVVGAARRLKQPPAETQAEPQRKLFEE
jgi:Family of unknown function (DUF6982)